MKRILVGALLVLGCEVEREPARESHTYAELAPLLTRACVPCHGPARSEAGYRVDDYLATISCTAAGEAITVPAQDSRFARALERADHLPLLRASERAWLRAWVEAGAPAFRGTVHEPGVIDPRSPSFHGPWLAQDGYRLLRDADAPEACGRCHDGAPVSPARVTLAAPGAPACTSCHDQPGGVLACSTCHGAAGRPHPPRDPCFFPDQRENAHTSHLERSTVLGEPLACQDCHPAPGERLFEGLHANGSVDVALSAPRAGNSAQYDADEESCMVACHARGGKEPVLGWFTRESVSCQSCHLSPPAAHFPGPCAGCHADMGEAPDALLPDSTQHMNGVVDLGRGTGTCGACHGDAERGAPNDRGHALHLSSGLTLAIACSDCHPQPAQPVSSGHLNGAVDLQFGVRASARGAMPGWVQTTAACQDVACHGADLSPSGSFSWREPEEAACTSCHGAPPPSPHVARTSCSGGLCHGDEVGLSGTKLRITERGRTRHIDGVVSTGVE